MGTPAVTVLVEGASDRRALLVLAERRGHDLTDLTGDAAVAVVAMGGITNLRAHLARVPHGRVAVLHDAPERAVVDRVLAGRSDAARVTSYACDRDLEDELVRALGVPGTLAVVEAAGHLRSFHRLQSQPAQRGRPETDQLRRFFSARSGHKLRYAELLAGALDLDALPPPLRLLLDDLDRWRR